MSTPKTCPTCNGEGVIENGTRRCPECSDGAVIQRPSDEASHTAGPWRAAFGVAGVHRVYAPGEVHIATVFGSGSSKEDIANAHLIATSTELLDWLEKAAQMAHQQHQGGDDAPLNSAWQWLAVHASAVVAKAKGEA